MRDFIMDIVQLFTIGLEKSLVGIILFSNDATLHFNIKTHTNINDLLTAINDLPYQGRNTNTAAALELLLNSAQDGTMGLRPLMVQQLTEILRLYLWLKESVNRKYFSLSMLLALRMKLT